MRMRKKAALFILAAVLAILAAVEGAGKTYAKEEEHVSEAENEAEDAETDRKGTVRIDYRENADGTDPIAGAEFTFYRISDGETSEAGRVRTDRKGNAEIELAEGSYEVRETEPAPGHEASVSFRLTIPMRDEEGNQTYVITAEPKPAKLPEEPPASEESPAPSGTPEPSAPAESVPERSSSVSEQVRRTTEEVKKITTGTITREVKKEIIRQKKQAGKANQVQTVQPVRTSDSGDTALYLVIAGSSAAVCGVMVWIRKKGGRNA